MHNVIVTGGSRGLGLGVARKLARAGSRVIAVARREGEQLAAIIRDQERGQPGSLHFKPFDRADLSGIPALIKELRQDFGPIYALVNNAALGTSGILARILCLPSS